MRRACRFTVSVSPAEAMSPWVGPQKVRKRVDDNRTRSTSTNGKTAGHRRFSLTGNDDQSRAPGSASTCKRPGQRPNQGSLPVDCPHQNGGLPPSASPQPPGSGPPRTATGGCRSPGWSLPWRARGPAGRSPRRSRPRSARRRRSAAGRAAGSRSSPLRPGSSASDARRCSGAAASPPRPGPSSGACLPDSGGRRSIRLALA